MFNEKEESGLLQSWGQLISEIIMFSGVVKNWETTQYMSFLINSKLVSCSHQFIIYQKILANNKIFELC